MKEMISATKIQSLLVLSIMQVFEMCLSINISMTFLFKTLCVIAFALVNKDRANKDLNLGLFLHQYIS